MTNVPEEKNVPTATRYMNDCVLDGVPPSGADVLATTEGGVTVRHTWVRGDEKYYVAWEYHGKLKPETKQRLMGKYK